MTYTVEDLNAALEVALGGEWSHYDDYREVLEFAEDGTLTVELDDNTYAVSVVDQMGGMGQGDQAYFVISVTLDNDVRFFEVDGYYESFDGAYYDGDLYEVKPETKSIVVYKAI